MMKSDICLRRVYELADSSDGTRVLIDRLWPRGLRKADVILDLWLQEIAPTSELRKWFNHDPSRFEEFSERYRFELAGNPGPVNSLRSLAAKGRVTLLYAAHDGRFNHAVVLAQYLDAQS
nr:DUF488 domain-containing protein [Rhizobium ruizarguesonis]